MPTSDTEAEEDTRLAIAAETLYLLNLLLLPGIAFLILIGLYLYYRNNASSLSTGHLKQGISASLWAGFLLVFCNLFILLSGGYDGPWTWVIIVLYFTIAHSTLILLGIIGLIKALAGQHWHYPLIGGLLR